MTHAKQITKTAATFIFCLLIAYALFTAISGQPNLMVWPIGDRAAMVAAACLATVLLNQKSPNNEQ